MFLDGASPLNRRLYEGDQFSFACHSGLACYNTCCRNKHLPLTPYDVMRLKNALGLHSDDFLARYTLYTTDPRSGFPVLSLKMGDDSDKVCPFVGPEGCRVYDDRPMACRLFPLGRSVGNRGETKKGEVCFYLLETPYCLGTKEKRIWTVKEWVNDQGLRPYTSMSDSMVHLLLHPRRKGNDRLDDLQIQKLFVACYNVDVFRDFVFKTAFFELFGVAENTRAAIQSDDQALLKLGLAYLKRTLFPKS